MIENEQAETNKKKYWKKKMHNQHLLCILREIPVQL